MNGQAITRQREVMANRVQGRDAEAILYCAAASFRARAAADALARRPLIVVDY